MIFNVAHASVDHLAQAIRFFIAHETRYTRLENKSVLTENGVVDHTPRRGEAIDPSFSLTTEAAQQLFEELWSQGFRSVHDRDAGDRVDAARREHIADLRKVAKIG